MPTSAIIAMSVEFAIILALVAFSLGVWFKLEDSERDRKGLSRQLEVETELNGKLQRTIMDHLMSDLNALVRDIQAPGSQPPASN